MTNKGIDMNIYKRHFRVDSGPVIEATRRIHEERQASLSAIKELINSVGAEDAKVSKSGAVLGFTFKGSPDNKTWKLTKRGWYWPKLNSNAGRDLAKRIKSLPTYPDFDSALTEAGLHPHSPALIDEWKGIGHYPTLTGHPDIGVWFVNVPWRDIDADELEQYKKERAAGTRFCLSMDHLLWAPPAEFKEVKEWQVLKELEEINEKLRAMRSQSREADTEQVL